MVRNYTDVGHLTGDNIGDADTGEDRMDRAASREGLTPDAIADKYIASFQRDIKLLNADIKADSADTMDHTPRATSYIKEIQEMVDKLLDKGFAYETSGGIYFDVSKYPEYTRLSGQKLDLQSAHAGHGVVSDGDKRNSADFALWIYAKGTHARALQTWDYTPTLSTGREPQSERCVGFPGWHIECSAMSHALLGSHFDIHMGGIEHIPVHHSNEIAQSESANGEKYVNYWVHNEHLLVDGKKMSKSEGTSYLLSDIMAKGIHPLTLRYFFLQAHYRSKQNFTWEALEASDVAYNKLKRQIEILRQSPVSLVIKPADVDTNAMQIQEKFLKAINNDFNFAQALAMVWTLIKDKELSSEAKLHLIDDFNTVFGLEL